MTPDRPTDIVLRERAAHLAFLSTERVYSLRPDLWDTGERGRHHTLQDFTYHFEAMASGPEAMRRHAEYCYRLFAERELPRHWLDGAWKTMRTICDEALEGAALHAARAALDAIEVQG